MTSANSDDALFQQHKHHNRIKINAFVSVSVFIIFINVCRQEKQKLKTWKKKLEKVEISVFFKDYQDMREDVR
jgi:hypothetical protein